MAGLLFRGVFLTTEDTEDTEVTEVTEAELAVGISFPLSRIYSLWQGCHGTPRPSQGRGAGGEG
ncbi:hypothetical protein LBMAG46_33450 [Planctomycetia bacterium]|nr:hypothetical protein LBMAG46_33450 [Planctomycetia bacterium]